MFQEGTEIRMDATCAVRTEGPVRARTRPARRAGAFPAVRNGEPALRHGPTPTP